MTGKHPRLILLRHGEVESHRGDHALTAAGRDQAHGAGRRLADAVGGSVRMLSGATRRTRETAQLVGEALAAADPARSVSGPDVAFALRNPDLYLAGERVDMVSTADAFAAQVTGLTAGEVMAVPFFHGFLTAPDRIEFWVHHDAPPGDDAAHVAERIGAFAASLGDRGPAAPDAVVCVTHSPVLRAVAVGLGLDDPGEPPYLTGYEVRIGPEGASAAPFDPFT